MRRRARAGTARRRRRRARGRGQRAADERRRRARAPRALRRGRGSRAAPCACRILDRAGGGDGRRRSRAARRTRRGGARAPWSYRDALRHRSHDVARRRAGGVAPLGHPDRVGVTRPRLGDDLPPRCRQPAPTAQTATGCTRPALAVEPSRTSPGARSDPRGGTRGRDRGRKHPRAVRHRREPVDRVPTTPPPGGRVTDARRAGRRRRHRQRAHGDRDPRAAGDRATRTSRHHPRRTHRAAIGCASDATGRRTGGGASTGLVDVRRIAARRWVGPHRAA